MRLKDSETTSGMPRLLSFLSHQWLCTLQAPGLWTGLQAATHDRVTLSMLLRRALGEYATTNNATNERAAKDLVNRTFGTIQDFDFQLFSATRNKQQVGKVGKEAEAKLQQAVSAMDALLATVPADSMAKARVRATFATWLPVILGAAYCG